MRLRRTLLLLALCWVVSAVGSAQQPARSKPVSFAILEDYDKGDDLADVAADFELFAQLGIRVWRGSIGWDDYEPARGRFDFAWLNQFAELAARHGIGLRPYLAFTPEWAARRGGSDQDAWNNPPAALREWERFASAVAGALARHENVLSVEIYNEQNVPQWWDGTPAEYAQVLTRASRAIRARSPRTALVFGGLVWPDTEWVEAVCDSPRASRAFSVLPIHAYPETWTPAGVTVENYLGGLAEFLRVTDAACGPKAIWVNETGFATTPGKTEREQAHWWVRATATFLATPRVEHVGVYEIKDLPRDRPVIGDAPNYHLGIARSNRAPKLAFHTVDLLTDLLDTGTLVVEDARAATAIVDGTEADVYRHLFRRPDGDRVLVLWSRAGASVRVTLADGGSAVEYQMDGRPVRRTAATVRNVRLAAGEPRIFRLGS